MSVASLVIGIISIILAFIPFCNFFIVIPAIVGVVLGIITIVSKKQQEGEKSKKGIGIAGLILNAIAILVLIVYFIIFVSNIGKEIMNENKSYTNNIKTEDALGTLYDSMSGIADKGINYNKFDDVSNKKWKLNDGSLITLNRDNTFYWYKEADNLNDNYYAGKYKVYQGENAIRYIANELSKYGITEDEQRETIERVEKYHVYNYYCLVLENENCIVGGENTMNNPTTSPYWGFYFNENSKETLDFASMNTGSYYLFTNVK